MESHVVLEASLLDAVLVSECAAFGSFMEVVRTEFAKHAVTQSDANVADARPGRSKPEGWTSGVEPENRPAISSVLTARE
jgi:hypothetical protein